MTHAQLLQPINLVLFPKVTIVKELLGKYQGVRKYSQYVDLYPVWSWAWQFHVAFYLSRWKYTCSWPYTSGRRTKIQTWSKKKNNNLSELLIKCMDLPSLYLEKRMLWAFRMRTMFFGSGPSVSLDLLQRNSYALFTASNISWNVKWVSFNTCMYFMSFIYKRWIFLS